MFPRARTAAREAQENDRQRHAGVEGAHQRHQPLCRPADARRAARQRQRDRQRKQKPHEKTQRRLRERGKERCKGEGGRLRRGVGLHHIADAKGGQRPEQGEDTRERGKAPAQGADIVHRPAVKAPVRRPLAIAHGEDDFDVLRGHAEECRHPHPEHCPRPAQGDGPGHAGDVARAHRGRQRRGHRLQRRYFPGSCVFAAGERAQRQAQHVPKTAELHKAGAQGKGHAREREQKQHRPTPDHAREPFVES